MSLHWTLALILGAAAILFLVGNRMASKVISRRQVLTTLLPSCLLALPAFLCATYYTHCFDHAWFYQFRSLPGTEFLSAGAGFPAGLLHALLRRKGVVSAAGIPLVLGFGLFVPFAKPLLHPVDLRIIQERWSDDVCLQSTGSTCGPSSAATLLKAAGIAASERELAAECHTSDRGTENWYLARALRKRGLPFEYVTTVPNPPTLPYPSIAGVQLGGPGGMGHFITILGQNDQGYLMGDPLFGKAVFDQEKLRMKYHFTGFFMVSKPAR